MVFTLSLAPFVISLTNIKIIDFYYSTKNSAQHYKPMILRTNQTRMKVGGKFKFFGKGISTNKNDGLFQV